jgi:hypothetical protein
MSTADRGKPKGRDARHRCAFCLHISRHQYEVWLASGLGMKTVARRSGLSYGTVTNHWARHVPDFIKRRLVQSRVVAYELADKCANESAETIDHLRYIRSGLYRLYDLALEGGDVALGAIAAGRLHENLRDGSRLTGELTAAPFLQVNNTQVNLFSLPSFHALQLKMLKALRPFPEARDALIKALKEVEESAPTQLDGKQAPPLIESKANGKHTARHTEAAD